MSFFRYPGGKKKLRKLIAEHLSLFSECVEYEYREPFFGGGSIGLKFMDEHAPRRLWINDKDIALACLWTSVIRYPDKLKDRIMGFAPTVEAFYQFKEELLALEKEPGNPIEWGFKKLAIHQISYSGLGTMSGGPLGGQKQASQYGVDCRWSPENICKKIDSLHQKFALWIPRRHGCTMMDFEVLIRDETPAVLYLDPPYYVKGNDLYQCGFSVSDHERLANALKETRNHWILSYDDCPEVRELYDWAAFESVGVNYSITGTKDKDTGRRNSTNKPELLIYPKSHATWIAEKRNALSTRGD